MVYMPKQCQSAFSPIAADKFQAAKPLCLWCILIHYNINYNRQSPSSYLIQQIHAISPKFAVTGSKIAHYVKNQTTPLNKFIMQLMTQNKNKVKNNNN